MRLRSAPDPARHQDSFQDLLCLGPHRKQVALESPNCPEGEGAVARRPMRQPRKGVLALTGNDAAARRRLCFRRDGPAPKAGASTWKDPNCGRRLWNSGPPGAIAAGPHGSWRRDSGYGAKISSQQSRPASGKSRALMFIALDKLQNQGLEQAIIVVPENQSARAFTPQSGRHWCGSLLCDLQATLSVKQRGDVLTVQ